ncbi:hypothetical protein [Bradyrhizobium sp. NAS80.1]|uniref:hypothetical protein n=1 Tax=Bradyrhizobium sp. NAS80.1 TaxID=1680159 RepID=UPI001160FE81|nr:hypothetical protein [Bradyrhizobium sp. NAS80.1]
MMTFVAGSGPLLAASQEGPADSAECKELTARIVERTGARFDHFSPTRHTVFFKDPDMVLTCTTHQLTGVSLSWQASGFPPNAWFALAASAGNAVTNVDLKALEAAARKCHRLALKDKSELADLELPKAKVECQAFTRDGGAVVLDIWINDKAAQK